ncbi:MAG: hypothetical protein FWG85_05065 [Bacteroidetes bacterium]|nr:hypothetical protein [Bacteroidota bacterium]
MKSKYLKRSLKIGLLIVAMVFVVGCEKDVCDVKPPKWNPPQPIDILLLGSWKLDWKFNDESIGYTIVTFYENNECIIKHQSDYVYSDEEFRNWYVEYDTLILPGSYDSRVMRFPAYKYKLEGNDLLYIEFINYPFVGCGNFTLEGPLSPLGTGFPDSPMLEYKRFEEE